ncbi:hypothetical protein BDZ89DRAFT_1068964 [Hymenopellis radicata]|nr:hypothetical protein BDZ89DRAFT_1068964 [Hymenopellis radicata]
MPARPNRNGLNRNNINHQSPSGEHDTADDDTNDTPLRSGHTRSPVFAREPTMLQSFSRTVRNYVPSSIPIPAAAPSPPLSSSFFDDAGIPSGLAQAMYKSTTGVDPILWSRWDSLRDTRLLILGYATGLQVWDCSNLGAVTEVLNLTDCPDVAIYAAVLPGHTALGILTRDYNFLVYSLTLHHIIQRIPLSTPAHTFSANNEYIVISSTNPPALQVLASSTFSVIHTVLSSTLVPFTDGTCAPRPIFALSRRLLAYASVPPPLITTIPTIVSNPAKPFSSTAKSMLSSMKTLGGMAFSAAVNQLGAGDTPPTAHGGRFFSRSAPAASGTDDSYIASPSNEEQLSEAGHYITVTDLRSGVPIARFLASAKHAPLSSLSFSPDGCSLLSTTKDGQVARVYRLKPTPSGPSPVLTSSDDTPLHVYDLRRGRTSAIVESVEWSNDSRWVAICTRKRTIHVFAVNPYGGPPDLESHLSGRVINSDNMQPLSVEVAPVIRLRPTSHHPHSNANGNSGSVPPPLLPSVFKFLDSYPQTLPPSLLPIGTPQPPSLPMPSSSPSSPGSPRHPHTPQQLMKNFQDMLVFDPVDGLLQLRRWILSAGSVRESRDLTSMGGMTSVSLPLGLGLGVPSSCSPRHGGRRMSSSGLSPDMAGIAPEGKADGELVAVKESIVATWDLRRRRDWSEVKKRFDDDDDETLTDLDFLSQAELSTCSKSSRILPRSVYLSHQFTFHTLGEDYHALIRRYQFDIPGAKVEVRKQVQVSAYSTSATGGEAFVEGSPVSRRSFDEPLASALLQTDGFADRSRVGTVLPMLPNGTGHSSVRMTSIPIRGVSESLGRLRRDMMVASRKTGRSSGAWRRSSGAEAEGMSMSVPLEFDEEEEDFKFQAQSDEDRLRDEGSASRGEDDLNHLSTSTPATSLYPMDPEEDRGGVPLDDDVWNDGWGVEDKKAIEEVEMYDHISAVGLLDEEQEEMDRKLREEKAAAAAVVSPPKVRHSKSEKKRKGKKI